MQLLLTLPLVLVLTACASGGGTRSGVEPADVQRTTRIESAEGSVVLRTTRSNPTNQFTVAGTLDQLWRAMPLVFAELGMPVTMRVPDQRAMGNPAFRVRRRLGGVRLSRYLDCGNQLGMLNADSYEVTLRLEMRLAEGAVADQSRLLTVVEGTARPMDVSGAPVNCTSTGQMEKQLLTLLTEQVRRGG